jgi:hypothetical protein
MRRTIPRLLAWAALGAISGIVASALHADYIIVAMVAFWLGFVLLPLAAAGAAYLAHRRGVFVLAASFAASASIANYFSNLALLGDQLRPHSWAYAIATLLAALVLAGAFLALAPRLRRPTSGCS